MDLSLPALARLLQLSVTDPRAAARVLMDMNPPMPLRWLALVLVSVLSALAMHGTILLVPAPDGDDLSLLLPGPLGTALLQGVIMLGIAGLAQGVGRMAGGRGRFADALLLVSWLQAVLLVLQVVQTLLLLALPPLGGLVGLAGFALMFWLLTGFIAELHGFRSLPMVFLAVLGVLVGLAVGLGVVVMVLLGGAA